MLPPDERKTDKEDAAVDNSQFDLFLAALPVMVPLAAFNGYDEVLRFVTWAIDNGPGDWMAVDGGKIQVDLLAPTINGVILPSISIALGTLSATTISSLRDRQITLRECLHKEACLLDILFSASVTIFDGRRRDEERRSALMLLQCYCSRLITESSRRLDFDQLLRSGAADSEIRAFIRLLHRSPPLRDSIDATGAPLAFHEAALAGFYPGVTAGSKAHDAPIDESRIDTAIEPRTFDAMSFNAQLNCKEILMIRSERLALLQTTFPPIHWASMSLLGISIIVCFLLETDEKALQFLDLFQLRVIFTILIGSLTGIASICIDLNDPFRGSFRLTKSGTGQIYVLRELILEELGEVPPSHLTAAATNGKQATVGSAR